MTVPHYRLAVVQAGTSYGKSTAWAAFAAEVPGIICVPRIRIHRILSHYPGLSTFFSQKVWQLPSNSRAILD
jgi:hypothetical protein